MPCDHFEDDQRTTDLSRRTFIQAAGAGVATLALSPPALPGSVEADRERPPIPVPNRAPLAAQPYMLLPLGSIKPSGWLLKQLAIQANGLSGHLGEVWPDVGAESGWLGGSGDTWERGPYYLDGLVPLAWALDSNPLKAKALQFVEWILASQSANGMIGPKSEDRPSFADPWWPRMIMMKALMQYQELTSDPRVIPFMTRYFHYQLQELVKEPLVEVSRCRWQDQVVSLVWLYNRTGDPELIKLARLLEQQGVNWRQAFEEFRFKERVTYREYYVLSEDVRNTCHGVNNAMAIKASALSSIISGSERDRTAVKQQLETLDRYHGLPTGIFAADENFAGRNPSQGTELCAVVEAMYSLEQCLAISGDPSLADRLERIAYNALPAALTDDMWAHQYDQQPNQIQCSLSGGPWATNGPDANLFGLEPNYGCCTANYHQGWPKLAAGLWMASAEGGLAAMLYAPCDVTTRVHNVNVRLTEETGYPFRDQVRITIAPDRPVAFPLKLRVPGWAKGAKLQVNGRALVLQAKDGFTVIERTWRMGDRVDLTFEFETRAVGGFNQSVSIEHGPLLFVLPIGTRWQKLKDHGLSSADWEVYPTGAWNYGIEEGAQFHRHEQPISSVPFSDRGPPVTVTVNAQVVPDWTADPSGAYALPPPPIPMAAGGSSETVTLIPYGSAKLRITSFPTVKG